MASDLLTAAEFYTRTGRDPNALSPQDAARFPALITAASIAVRNFVDRDLTLAADADQSPRTFRYYGRGMVEIDDCTAITQVATSVTAWSPASRLLDPSEYIAGATSSNLPVLDYIELWTNLPMVAASPAMGFTWNADRYGYRPHPVLLTVTANWGWAAIPEDVKMAVVWTVGAFEVPETPYISESIAGYSHTLERTRGGGGGGNDGGGGGPSLTGSMEQAVPERAQALLAPYVRVNV